jgi:hypothetical protein
MEKARLYNRQVATVGTIVKNYHIREKLPQKDISGCRVLRLECEFCKAQLKLSLYELLRRKSICICRKQDAEPKATTTIVLALPQSRLHSFKLDYRISLENRLQRMLQKTTTLKDIGYENITVYEIVGDLLRKIGNLKDILEAPPIKKPGRPRKNPVLISEPDTGIKELEVQPPPLPQEPEPPKEELSWPSFLLEDPADYIWFTAQAPQNRFPPKYITDWVEEANYDPKTSKLFSVATEEGLRVHYKTLPREEAPAVSSRMPTWSFDDDDDTPF